MNRAHPHVLLCKAGLSRGMQVAQFGNTLRLIFGNLLSARLPGNEASRQKRNEGRYCVSI